jgi:D-alanyl-D-alanine carboxypeptidase
MRTEILIFLLLLSGLTITAQNIDQTQLDRFISHIESNNQGVGAVSVFKEGKEVYHRSFGHDSITGLKWNRHTKYQIGSITKVFTAVLIWKLIEEGKLSPDDKLVQFYPQIPNAGKITIQNLLEHSSGIKRDYSNKPDNKNWLLESEVTDKEIIHEITRQGIDFEPGDSIAYSNSAYYLLKNIVEQKYGKGYGKVLQKEIIKPNGLKDFVAADMNLQHLFSSYQYNYLDAAWQTKPDYVYRNIIGVGDIATLPSQLNKFFYNLFQGKVVKPETLQQMLPSEKEDFGRNLAGINFYTTKTYGHAGDTKGTHSLVVFDPETNIGFSVSLIGQRYPKNDFYIAIYNAIYTDKKELPYFAAVQDLKKHEGVYYNQAYDLTLKVYIDAESGLMCEDVGAEASFPLTPYAAQKFKFDQFGIKIEFKENQILFTQEGERITLTRQP